MAATDFSQEAVWCPSSRAFFVYYVAVAVAVFGPLINPAVGVPSWVGFIVGLLVLAMVGLRKFGQEFKATPRSLKKVTFWPAGEEDISWPEVGEITVQRGLTQTLLNTGNVVVHDKQGVPRLCWEHLADPNGVKEALKARQAGLSERSEAEPRAS